MCQILEGEGDINPENIIPEDLTPNHMTFFKFASITSVDVQRPFSVYKNLLEDNRRHSNSKTLKKFLLYSVI